MERSNKCHQYKSKRLLGQYIDLIRIMPDRFVI